ncbi:MAG TPA: hypothetical protein VHI14_03900 [Jatrophihabitantaceae bacterium]|nr:hypothetical protein [Jatrophihabitantaceae bacterium]
MRAHLLLVLPICVALAACSSGAAKPPTATSQKPTSRPSSSGPARDGAFITKRITVGTQPCGVVASRQRIWVSNYGDNTLQWLDPSTGKPGKPIKVGLSPCGVALGAGSVWVENYGDSSLTRVNATTGAVQRTITTGNQPYDVAFLDGAAWVTDYLDGTVSRIDAITNKRTVVPTGGQPTGIAPSHGSLWVTLGTANQVVQIDAASTRVVKRLTVPGRPTWTAFTDDAVWISQTANGDVVRIDTANATIAKTIHLGAARVPQDGAVVAGGVWVPCADGSLFRIDVGTDAVTGPWPTNDGNPFVLDGHGSTLWAPDYRGTTVAKIDITKLP